MLPLTAKQKELLAYLRSCDTCPSFDEMRDALGLKNKSGVHRLLSALEERGFISRMSNRARAITLHDPSPDLSLVPTNALWDEILRRSAVERKAA